MSFSIYLYTSFRKIHTVVLHHIKFDTCCRGPQQILLVLSIKATRTDHTQAFKYMTLKMKVKRTYTCILNF